MRKKTFLMTGILSVCLLLQACAPLMLAAGAAVGGAVLYDKRNFQTWLRDQSIASKIRERLNDDAILQHRAHIAVATFDGIVLLVGQAPIPVLRVRAYRIASSVPHVRRIFNQITLEPPTPPITRTNDVWITAKVKSALLAKKGMHSTQIKVVTENGTVFLMGLVSSQQGAMAAETARRVSGVLKVVKLFEYTYTK